MDPLIDYQQDPIDKIINRVTQPIMAKKESLQEYKDEPSTLSSMEANFNKGMGLQTFKEDSSLLSGIGVQTFREEPSLLSSLGMKQISHDEAMKIESNRGMVNPEENNKNPWSTNWSR